MLQFLSYYGPQRVEEAVAAVPGMNYRGLAVSSDWVPLGVQTSELLTKQLQVTDSPRPTEFSSEITGDSMLEFACD